ncbi:MAG: hypothetical protein NVS2B16_30420 [Chloroflexota bacterium]
MVANNRGSFSQPAPGWLTINLGGNSSPNTSLPVDESADWSPLPGRVTPGAVSVFYTNSNGVNEPGAGRIALGTLEIDRTSAGGVVIELGLSGITVSGEAGVRRFSGSLGARAISSAATGGGGGQGGGGGGCADNGQSCVSGDGCYTRWKSQCEGQATAQAACQCAAAALYDCFLRHGCYKEAGAATSVTKATLEQGKATSIANAASLGTACFGSQGGACR